MMVALEYLFREGKLTNTRIACLTVSIVSVVCGFILQELRIRELESAVRRIERGRV